MPQKVKTKSKELNLAETGIMSLIAQFALPAILANLVGSVYNIADQIFVGQKLGTAGNAATNIAFPLVLLMMTFSTMIGSGGSSQFSLHQGAGKDEKAGRIVGNSLFALALSGLLLMAISLIFLRPLMIIFGAKGNTLDLAMEYTRIIAIGIPFQIFGSGGSMFIRADGSPRYAMLSTLIGAVINIILNPLFMFGLDMGISGSALATITGQISGAAITLLYFPHFKSVPLKKSFFRPDPVVLRKICSLGLPAGFMQIAVMLVEITMNNTLGYYGERSIYGRDIPIAVCGVVTKINAIFTATLMGICQACQPIFGYNYGAGNYKRVRSTFLSTAILVTVVPAVSVVLFQLFPHQILGIFQKGDPLYFAFGTDYLRIFMGAIFLNGITLLVAGFYPSIGMAKKGIVASLSRQVLFQLPLILLFPLIWGLDGVLYAGPAADTCACLLCVFMVRRTLSSI